MTKNYITKDSKLRKQQPMAAGLLDYFPAALAAVAEHSFIGNEKHNPGQTLHWSRQNSADHADCIVRHVIDRGEFEEVTFNGKTYIVRHSAALAWRALALLQEELEAEGATPGRGSRFPEAIKDPTPLNFGVSDDFMNNQHWELTPKAHAAIKDFNRLDASVKRGRRGAAAQKASKRAAKRSRAVPKPVRKRK